MATPRRDALYEYVRTNPGKTATQIAGGMTSRGERFTPSHISGLLAKMLKQNRVKRVKGSGPRGGFVYTAVDDLSAKVEKAARPTAWSIILNDDDD